jgi:hypothetical protein
MPLRQVLHPAMVRQGTTAAGEAAQPLPSPIPLSEGPPERDPQVPDV